MAHNSLNISDCWIRWKCWRWKIDRCAICRKACNAEFASPSPSSVDRKSSFSTNRRQESIPSQGMTQNTQIVNYETVRKVDADRRKIYIENMSVLIKMFIGYWKSGKMEEIWVEIIFVFHKDKVQSTLIVCSRMQSVDPVQVNKVIFNLLFCPSIVEEVLWQKVRQRI